MSVSRKEAFQMFQEIKAKAIQLYGSKTSRLENTEFVIRDIGTIGGYAKYKTLTVELNVQMLNVSKYAVYDTLAHEMAHIVCFLTGLGRNHNEGWKRVCIALGGNGKRTHNHRFKPKRKTRQAIYNINGKELKIGLIQHKRIQQSTPNRRYSMRGCGTHILPEMFTGQIVNKA